MRQQNDAGHVVMPGRRHVASLLKRWLPDRQQVQGQPRAPRHVPQKLVHHDALLDRVGCKTPIRPAAGDASARSAWRRPGGIEPRPRERRSAVISCPLTWVRPCLPGRWHPPA